VTNVGLDVALIGLFAFVLSAALTLGVRRFALSRGLLDVPNARSSHSRVTPRGGGVAIVLSSVVAWLILAYIRSIQSHFLIALIGGGLAVAGIGFMDDRRPVPARIRLAVHLAAAIWAIEWLGPPTVLQLGSIVIHLGRLGPLLALLGITWFLNLFNFMDGIDGIAGSEAVFLSCAGGALTLVAGGFPSVAPVAVLLGAACAGFLLWNWPPAKIFMGDVGSGYLGYVIGVLVLAASRNDPGVVWVWLVLSGAFFIDASVTLARRAARGEPVSQAHRSHAYQWLARRWSSHARVTTVTILLNVLWLLPCATFAALDPPHAAWITLLALAPLVLLALIAGAGRRETQSESTPLRHTQAVGKSVKKS
jgi:Fuc2NAc and GlcNAc transferase